MNRARHVRQARLLAGLFAFAALACGSDTVNLLPAMGDSAGTPPSMAGTRSETGGGGNAASGGDSVDAGRAGSGAAGASGGSAGSGGSSCSGNACGGSASGGSFSIGGSAQCISPFDNCTPCAGEQQCPNNMRCGTTADVKNRCVWCLDDDDCGPNKDSRCDVITGRCGTPCDAEQRCTDNRVCDVAQDVCVQCVQRQDCERLRPDLPLCHQRRCVQCEISDDCNGPGRQYCIGYRCLDCLSNRDCPNGKFCNGDGHCS